MIFLCCSCVDQTGPYFVWTRLGFCSLCWGRDLTGLIPSCSPCSALTEVLVAPPLYLEPAGEVLQQRLFAPCTHPHQPNFLFFLINRVISQLLTAFPTPKCENSLYFPRSRTLCHDPCTFWASSTSLVLPGLELSVMTLVLFEPQVPP